MAKARPLRTSMYVPGNKEDWMRKAPQYGADALILDLEDSVPVSNKAEARGAEAGTYEAYALGLGEPVGISAEHGLGLADLRDAIVAAVGEGRALSEDEDDEEDEDDRPGWDDRRPGWSD